MAKHLYEEERIKDIAKKIRELAPGLRDGLFTTSEMPNGIERVFEEGERKGRTTGFTEGYGAGYSSGVLRGKEEGYDNGYNKGHEEGYQEGYTEGAEDNQGVELPTLTNPGTATDLVEGKQLIDGEGNIVEGAIPVRTADNVGVIGTEVAVPEGYYPERVEKEIDTQPFYNAGYNAGYSKGETDGYTGGYSTGYEIGKVDGAENLKTEEARTAADLDVERLDKNNLGLAVTSGYYGDGVTKVIDIKPYYTEGYEEGHEEGHYVGWQEGRNVGYTEGYNDGLTAGACTHEDGNGVAY